jgi:hypothetical protein
MFTLYRVRLTVGSYVSKPKLLHCKNIPLHHNYWILSATKKKAGKTQLDNVSDGENIGISSENNKKPTRRGTRKSSKKTTEEAIPVEANTNLTVDQEQAWTKDQPENIAVSLETINTSSETNKKTTRRGRRSSKETTEEIILAEATTELTADQEQVLMKNQPKNININISSGNVDISSENVDISSQSNMKSTRRSTKKFSKKTAEEIIPAEAATKLTEDHLEITKDPVTHTEELQNEKFHMTNLGMFLQLNWLSFFLLKKFWH